MAARSAVAARTAAAARLANPARWYSSTQLVQDVAPAEAPAAPSPPLKQITAQRQYNPRLVRLAAELLNLNHVDTMHVITGLQTVFSGSTADTQWYLPKGDAPVVAAPVVEEVVAAPPPPAKTHFDVKLKSFDAAQKLKVIKEVRAITNLGLKEAKELVEGSPAVLLKNVKKEEGDALVAKLKEVGAVVELE